MALQKYFKKQRKESYRHFYVYMANTTVNTIGAYMYLLRNNHEILGLEMFSGKCHFS